MWALLSDYRWPNQATDHIVLSYDGFSSYLLVVDDKTSKTWVFLTCTKEPPLELVQLFLHTFGWDKSINGFIRCNQGGELGRSPAFLDMTLKESNYKIELTAAPLRTDKPKNGMTCLL